MPERPYWVSSKADHMRFSIARHITFADVLSLSAAMLGFASMLMVVIGYAMIAAIAIIIAAFLDYIDGRISRKMGSNKHWGKEMDSLCDVVAFGVAPAFLAWPVIAAGLAGAYMGAAVLTGFFFSSLIIITGILRLARYNTTNINNIYVGMPITMNGIIFPLVWVATMGLAVDLRAVIMAVTCVLSAVLMISDFMIRKI